MDGTCLNGKSFLYPRRRCRAPFVYRLGRQIFNLERGVRTPLGSAKIFLQRFESSRLICVSSRRLCGKQAYHSPHIFWRISLCGPRTLHLRGKRGRRPPSLLGAQTIKDHPAGRRDSANLGRIGDGEAGLNVGRRPSSGSMVVAGEARVSKRTGRVTEKMPDDHFP